MMHEILIQLNDLPGEQTCYYLSYVLPNGKNCVDICPADKVKEYIEQAFKELTDGNEEAT